jgi:Cu(I)/Ag(I) efflux system membrane fusion protein
MKTPIKNKYLRYSLAIVAGLLLGWLFFHSPAKVEDKHEHAIADKSTIWTCSMHPQIRKTAPGKCPICGMDLIPLKIDSTSNIDPKAIHLSKEAAELANVLTSIVGKQKNTKEIRLYGKVQADEQLLQSQTAHLSGRIEQLNVNYTGQAVAKGQTLAIIYSPELLTAQQELLETAKSKTQQPEIYQAAKDKLRQWKLSNAQIDNIEKSGVVKNDFAITSNANGIVVNKRVNMGDYINQGTVLFDIADLSHVWVVFDAYESDLMFLKKGDKLSFSVQALANKTFLGNIFFISPVLDPTTRTAKVRVEISNAKGQLKPEMFATAIFSSKSNNNPNALVIPSSAVLWTGKRSIVYVKQSKTDEPVFNLREIEIGEQLGNAYVVLSGLKEGEEIVTQGTFNVDAAAQLEGKPSMMNGH